MVPKCWICILHGIFGMRVYGVYCWFYLPDWVPCFTFERNRLQSFWYTILLEKCQGEWILTLLSISVSLLDCMCCYECHFCLLWSWDNYFISFTSSFRNLVCNYVCMCSSYCYPVFECYLNCSFIITCLCLRGVFSLVRDLYANVGNKCAV